MVNYGAKMTQAVIFVVCSLCFYVSEGIHQYRHANNPSLIGSALVRPFFSRSKQAVSIQLRENLLGLRGGEEKNQHDESSEEKGDDEERYSRQVYTLGARAHSLIRKSSIIVDGPISSGLLYESVKNLALSGVGKIIILTSGLGDADNSIIDSTKEQNYFDSNFDDLGIAYRRGALAECFPERKDDDDVNDLDILLEYVKRLNPNVKIQTMSRTDFFNLIESKSERGMNAQCANTIELIGENPVFLSLERPESSQIILNEACRQGTIPFVGVETASVYGRIFCDFGDDFYVVDEDGETPKTTLLDRMEKSSDTDPKKRSDITIHCVEGEHHDVSKGDTIEFQWGENGSESFKRIRCQVAFVKTPICFTAKVVVDDDSVDMISIDDFINSVNQNVHSFSRKKIPKEIKFIPLSEAKKESDDPACSIFAASDLDKSFDLSRRFAVMRAFETLDKFAECHGRLPQPLNKENEDDIDIFVNLIDSTSNSGSSEVFRSFARFSRAKFMPIQAIFGALGAQEVLKAASGLYNPIKQFLLYDCDEVLSSKFCKDSNEVISTTNAAGMKYILGKKTVKKLGSQKIFVVGSGAIGCELLKNLAAIEAGTNRKKGGQIILTDMDTIEKSNLSRQLLFRDADVGKFKSVAAQEAVARMNPRVSMDIHTSKVGDDSKQESYFNDKFWAEKVNVVLNALDNVEARLYMDSQCIANRKAMVDAGTLGAKGNVQVVVPFQSESYGSSVDPPEPTIAVCTLKNFPYEISHTIQWGKDLFDGLFNRRPSQVNEYSQVLSSNSEGEVVRGLLQKLGDEAAANLVQELNEDCFVLDTKESIRSASIQWAVNLARKLFRDTINNLLIKHPEDSLDEDGEPFWTGTRRAPSPLVYSIEDDEQTEQQQQVNENLIDFVRFAARLRIEGYSSQKDSDLMGSDVSVEEAILALKTSYLSDDETNILKESSPISLAEKLIEPKKHAANINDLSIATFEKDDDSNGHVAFVTAASNLRAICYQIAPADRMETRRVAGRIVPAMVTTTALVSALQTIELIKLLQNAPLRSHKNAFVNLALPFFAFTSPLPAEKISGIHDSQYTIWDRMVFSESEKSSKKGGMTLKNLIHRIKKKIPSEELEVSNVSYGPFMLYADFLHGDDKEILGKPLRQLVEEAIVSDDDDEFETNESFDNTQISETQEIELQSLRRRSFIDFSVLVEDPETGEEAELPPVRVRFYSE